MKGDPVLKFGIYNTLKVHGWEKEIDFVLKLQVNHLFKLMVGLSNEKHP